jgi:hypothetical protein
VTAVHTAADSGIQAFWNNTYKALCALGTTLDAIVTTELDPGTGKNVTDQVSFHTIAGTDVGKPVPQQCCVLISYRTANASKKGRGRQYLPAITDTNVTNAGGISGSEANAIDTAWSAFLTSMQTTGTPVILHGGYHKDKVTGVVTYVPLSSDAITGIATRQEFATQRRRTNAQTTLYTPFVTL